MFIMVFPYKNIFLFSKIRSCEFVLLFRGVFFFDTSSVILRKKDEVGSGCQRGFGSSF